jgi:lipoate-protein ligase A
LETLAVIRCRLLIDHPACGAWNMAVDGVLLAWAAETGGCAWRFYQWDEPTLSLGYFQPYEDRQHHRPSHSCPVVRRATGGGAIVHDAELTYSLAVPFGSPLANRRLDLYRTVHRTLIEVLAARGILALLCEGTDRDPAATAPFLCFQRRSPGDVLVGTHKIAGSAQRRRRGAVLQHGSVLIERSVAAPELPGLNDLTADPIREETLMGLWLPAVGRRLGWRFVEQPLTQPERLLARNLAQTQYASATWNQRRGAGREFLLT